MPNPDEVNDPKKRNTIPERKAPDHVRSRKRYRDRQLSAIAIEHVDAEDSLSDRRSCPGDQENFAQACDAYSDQLIAQDGRQILIRCPAKKQEFGGTPKHERHR